MTKATLRIMRSKIEAYAEEIQAIENAGKHEDLYNELWDMLDSAGGIINEILGE